MSARSSKACDCIFGVTGRRVVAKTGENTRLCQSIEGEAVDITRLQVPPRPPKRQSKGCLFFCQSILAKTVKTPDLLHENSQSGAFCIYAAILIYLQRLLPVFLVLGGGMSAPTGGVQEVANFMLEIDGNIDKK